MDEYLEPIVTNLGITEPKKEGTTVGWWKPKCKKCKTSLVSEIIGTNVFWLFDCDCIKEIK